MRRRSFYEKFLAMLLIVTFPLLASADGTDETLATHGDLTDEVFTATTGLWVKLVSPDTNVSVDQGVTRVVVETGLGGGAGVSVNGKPVPFSHIGKRVTDYVHKNVTFTFYGVVLEPGPNALAITPLGADGIQAAPSTFTIYGAGPIAQMHGELGGELGADGRSVEPLHIQALDAWGHNARTGSRLKLAIVDGEAKLLGGIAPSPAPGADQAAATDPDAPIDVTIGDGGSVDVPVQAGLHSGPVHVSATAENAAATFGFSVTAHARAPLVTGVVDTGAGAVPGTADGSELAGARKQRVAFFGTGAVAARTNLTVAYDSAQALSPAAQPGEAQSDVSENPYTTYGDGSVHGSQAVSQDHLYARVEKGLSSASWGQFNEHFGDGNAAANYSQTLNGADVVLSSRDGHSQISGFRSRDNVAFARAVFTPAQLASTQTTLQPDVIVDTDVVTLVTLDRHTGAVLSQTPMIRNVDYTITYGTGDLRFINVPLPYDPSFNPNTVVVQYQYGGAGAHASTSGATFLKRLGAVDVQGGALSSDAGDSTFTMSTEEVAAHGNHVSWSLAHAHAMGTDNDPSILDQDPTQSVGYSSGDAYRGTFTYSAQRSTLQANFDATSAGYQNPYGGLTTPGLADYHAQYTNRDPSGKNEAGIEMSHQQNAYNGTENQQSTARVHITRSLSSRLKLTAALDEAESGTATAAATPAPGESALPTVAATPSSGTALQGEVGVEYKAPRGVSLSLRRLSTLAMSGQGDVAQPSETDAQIEDKLPNKGRVYLRELWTDSPTESFAASTLGLTAASTSTHSTVLGFDTPLSCATTFTSQYGIDETGSGSDLYSTIGVKTRYALSSHLNGDLNVQTLNSGGASNGAAEIYGATLAFKNGTSSAATMSINERTGASAGTAITLGTSDHLAHDLSLVAALDQANTLGTTSTDARIGVTMRPLDDEGGALLAAFERRAGAASIYGGGETDTLSLDGLEPLGARTEVAARLAYKLDGDSSYAAHTALLALRIRRQLGSIFDIGTELRSTGVVGVAGSGMNGIAFETGARVGGSLRVAAGYSFNRMADVSLAAAPSRSGFYVTATSMINRIFGWGKSPF